MCSSAFASHQPEDPAAPNTLHPTRKDARMLKRCGRKEGHTGVSSGLRAKEIGNTVGEPMRSTGKGSQVTAVGS